MAITIGRRRVDGYALIGVVHLLPLPGAARSTLTIDRIWDRALAESEIYAAHGMDAIIIENHGDTPFPKESVLPHVTSIMAIFVDRLRTRLGLPVGVNVLRNDAIGAMGAAFAGGGDFIRVNVLSGVTATDQGLIEGAAERLMDYRRRLAANVQVFADAEVKFGTPLYRPSLATLIQSLAHRSLADAVIVTGEGTGKAPTLEKLAEARAGAGDVPLLVGSGAGAESIREMARSTDGAIVGSALKYDGRVENPVDPDRVRAFVRAARG